MRLTSFSILACPNLLQTRSKLLSIFETQNHLSTGANMNVYIIIKALCIFVHTYGGQRSAPVSPLTTFHLNSEKRSFTEPRAQHFDWALVPRRSFQGPPISIPQYWGYKHVPQF